MNTWRFCPCWAVCYDPAAVLLASKVINSINLHYFLFLLFRVQLPPFHLWICLLPHNSTGHHCCARSDPAVPAGAFLSRCISAFVLLMV